MTETMQPPRKFKVDTSRPRSRSKIRSKLRHVLATAAGMFPLMAAFVYLMSLFRLPVERMPYYRLAIVFFACGMVALMFYAWARSEKLRRHEVSARNRELKYREREEEFRRNQETRSGRPVPAAEEG
jgi:Na+/melibiose symporter-like transporter